MTINPESNWFGEKPVTPEEKTGLVRGVFDSVASKYDIMNDLMSGGVHRLWKDRVVREVRPRAGKTYLDVAGGTGDIAFRIHRKVGGQARIILCDLNEHMLSVGRDRAIDRGWSDLEWVTGNAESIPLPDNSVDTYTIAFGLRNVTRIDTALSEAFRVLKPGGNFFCLEFSRVNNPLLAKAYDLYSFNAIPRIGQMVANDRDSYEYLVESIRKFPPQHDLKKRMENAGFSRVAFCNLSGGIAAIHRGFKR
ncbi:MAG: bifunctional demethylmenaquinone methyltransferase/2-methoxy-6-polyprenyl-1,4-benzoquinol methylase UbiE [Alphaproteobacteria bacterium]|nr:bifunctional demethylmenaquinone methyltransferase/2-methoxy-6-polyprenyl-1,4-benzoquinol methylase UbiE [Alphaproteobacteria bacterium]